MFKIDQTSLKQTKKSFIRTAGDREGKTSGCEKGEKMCMGREKAVKGQKVISRKRKRIDMGVAECVQGLSEEGYRKWALKEKCKYVDGKEEGKTEMKQEKTMNK